MKLIHALMKRWGGFRYTSHIRKKLFGRSVNKTKDKSKLNTRTDLKSTHASTPKHMKHTNATQNTNSAFATLLFAVFPRGHMSKFPWRSLTLRRAARWAEVLFYTRAEPSLPVCVFVTDTAPLTGILRGYRWCSVLGLWNVLFIEEW